MFTFQNIEILVNVEGLLLSDFIKKMIWSTVSTKLKKNQSKSMEKR